MIFFNDFQLELFSLILFEEIHGKISSKFESGKESKVKRKDVFP